MDELRRRAQTLLDDPPVARTPITDLHRRAQRRRTSRTISSLAAVVVAVCVTAVAISANTSSGPGRVEVAPTNPPTPTTSETATTGAPLVVGAPATFVSTRSGADERTFVAISDAHTGKVVRTLYTVPSVEWTVSGTAIDPTGDVWITVNRGPVLGGHVAGGNPKPHTCASTVYRIDPHTGAIHNALVGGDNELITDAQPSPTGDRVAYFRAGCAGPTWYFDNTLVVKSLATGHTVEIGTGLARCHLALDARWTTDGQGIALVYGEATPSYPGGVGTCSQWKPGHLVVVSAETSMAGMSGAAAPPDAGCSIDSVTATADGYAAIEHCGPNVNIDGPVQLLRYDKSLRVVSRSPLGVCVNGSSVAGNARTASVIFSMYQYCGGSAATPLTNVFADLGTGQGPRRLLSIPGGYTAVDQISF